MVYSHGERRESHMAKLNQYWCVVERWEDAVRLRGDQRKVYDAIESGCVTLEEIQRSCGLTLVQTRNTANALKRKGVVTSVESEL